MMVAQHLRGILPFVDVPSQKLGDPSQELQQELHGTLGHMPSQVPLQPVSRHHVGKA